MLDVVVAEVQVEGGAGQAEVSGGVTVQPIQKKQRLNNRYKVTPNNTEYYRITQNNTE